MAGYIGTTPVPQATQHRESFTATGGQTSFATAGYTPQFIDVYLNGVKLAPADFTATNGSDVVLASGATASDILEIVAYTPFEVANQTFTGTTTAANLTVTGAFTSQGIDDNANAVAITIDSSENVGIGHSPTYKVDVSGTNPALRLKSSAAFGYIIDQNTSSGLVSHIVYENVDMRFGTNSTERMRITSAGSVGIGTSSPSAVLHLGGSSNQTIQVEGASNTAYYGTNGNRNDIFVNYDPTDGTIPNSGRSVAGIQLDGANGGSNLRFRTSGANNAASTERMRIDSSGNVLVGGITTLPSSSVNGFGVLPTGIIVSSVANDKVTVFGRTGSDGDISLFQKDGTTVGSIRSRAGVVSTIILDPRSGQGAGITGAGAGGDTTRFMTPTDENGSEINGKVSLGNSANAFRDLYLSGGVFLGGTGSANKLDDYEEGTYVVTLTPNSGTITINPSYNKLAYTKIGRQVTITGRFRVSSVSSPSGDVSVNLPFTSHNGSLESDFAALQVTYYSVDFASTTIKNFAEVNPNGTTASLLIERDNLPWTNVGGGAFNGSEIIYLNGTYLTDS